MNKYIMQYLNIYILLNICIVLAFALDSKTYPDSCFCEVKGVIDDCECNVESVDIFNNDKIFPLIQTILEMDFFRFYKVNIFRKCHFGSTGEGKCSSKSCAVDECKDEQIPSGLKNESENKIYREFMEFYSKKSNAKKPCKQKQNELGIIDSHISELNEKRFENWKTYDESIEFCEPEDDHTMSAVYYDLVRNPERFTGYVGASAVNVWQLIYDQNCFKPDDKAYTDYGKNKGKFKIKELCLEKRTFYRMISGFHTSINVDVTANWLKPAINAFSAPSWGPNFEEFRKRFNPKLTWGEGPQRLKNLYFLYLVELRALAKVAPYIEKEQFFTGSPKEDSEVKNLMKQLLKNVKEFPNHFDETKLFKDETHKLEEFKIHFRNISKIMDCVGCDKCRLWGKIQIRGLGTALKILFHGDFSNPFTPSTIPFQLSRGEIVSFINSFGRLSKSIHELEIFRKQKL